MKTKASEGEKPKRSDTATDYQCLILNSEIMKYKVTITETLQKEFLVEADSRCKATEKIGNNYFNAISDDYLLSASDYQGVEFKAEEVK